MTEQQTEPQGRMPTCTMDDVIHAVDGIQREQKIKDLLSCMTLEEKVRQMSGNAGLLDFLIMIVRYNHRPYPSGENKRHKIPPILFTDGPHGVAVGNSTCFPVSMARGATWDKELEQRIANAMGIETRAQGANFFGGVCINLPRHPGWGRAQESFGEDPYLLAEMGTAMIQGLQKHVMACAKHFAANSIEEARFFVDVKIDPRTLREVYLPHFRKCVDVKVAAFMSAYNKVNGKFCGHSKELLTDILKKEWGFDGFVVSDFMLGIRSAKAVLAGLDIEMPFTWRYGRRLLKQVRKGRIPESVIDEAVTRIIRKKAEFAEVGDPDGYDKSRVACKEHKDLALEAARKGIVLLKNEGPLLPLSEENVSKLAVIGKLADKANIGDKGSSQVYPPYTITPLQGIRDKAGQSVQVVYDHGKNLDRARQAAADADVAVVVVDRKSVV